MFTISETVPVARRCRWLRSTCIAAVCVAMGCCLSAPVFAQSTPNLDFRITQLPGDPVPLPTDGFSVRQMNGLWHEGSYYVYADVIDWDNPNHPASYDNSIGAYSSPDGVDWTYHGHVLLPGAAGEWDYGGVATPGVVEFQGKFYVAYSGREFSNGGGERFIGMAVADTPLGPFTKMPPIASQTGYPDSQPCFDDPQLVTRPGDDKMHLYYRYARRPEGSSTGALDYSIRLQTTTDPEQGWSDSQIILERAGGAVIETEEAMWIDGQFVMLTLEYGTPGGTHRVYVSADGEDYQPATLPSLSQHVPGVFRPNPAASLSGLLADGDNQARFLNTAGYTDGQGHYTQWIYPIETSSGVTEPQPVRFGGMYVSNTAGAGLINRFELPNTTDNRLPFYASLGNDREMILGLDGSLLIAALNRNTVMKFDFDTGIWSAFAEMSEYDFKPSGLVMAADGNLYVSSMMGDSSAGSIEKFDGTTGAHLGTIVSDLAYPRGLVFDNGWLYLAEGNGVDTITRYDLAGNLDVSWIASTGVNPRGLAIGPNGNLYAAVINTGGADGAVEQYDIATGALAGTWTSPDLYVALDVEFGDDGYAYVTDVVGDHVLRFDAATGAYDTEWSLSVTNPDSLLFDPRYGLPGDANRDGVIDDTDATILATNWQQSDATWAMGDFNGDGKVDDADATLLATNWQGSSSSQTANIPEPSAEVLLLGFLMLTSAVVAQRLSMALQCGLLTTASRGTARLPPK